MIDADADEASPMTPEERAARLVWIKARVEATLADPRPPVPLEEVSRRLKRLFEDDASKTDDAAA